MADKTQRAKIVLANIERAHRSIICSAIVHFLHFARIFSALFFGSSLLPSTLNRFKIHYNIFRISSAQSPIHSPPSRSTSPAYAFLLWLLWSANVRSRWMASEQRILCTALLQFYLRRRCSRCAISRFLQATMQDIFTEENVWIARTKNCLATSASTD